jgi:hypothetical protein
MAHMMPRATVRVAVVEAAGRRGSAVVADGAI